MSKVAIDVVLLPDEAVSDLAIAYNGSLSGADNAEIALNTADTQAHISLAMGCVDVEAVGEIEHCLGDLIRDAGVGLLHIIGVFIGPNRKGQNVSSFVVRRSRWILELHENIVRSLRPFFKYEPTAEMVLGEQVADTTLEWIKNYRSHASFENFFPHITIGYGVTKEIDSVIAFRPRALAVCHLGNHCTCKKILKEIKL